MGEVLRRLTSKVLQRVYSDPLRDTLAPLQMGIGVKGATEQIGRKLHRILKASPGSFVLQIDLSNAFNSVDRQAIQLALSSLHPELLPRLEFTHLQPSPLFCGEEILESQRGTQQGDPLGPAFFALAVHSTISSAAASEGTEWQVWYLDDGLLVGTAESLLRVLETLTSRFSDLGLKVNLTKCKLWSPQGILDLPSSFW